MIESITTVITHINLLNMGATLIILAVSFMLATVITKKKWDALILFVTFNIALSGMFQSAGLTDILAIGILVTSILALIIVAIIVWNPFTSMEESFGVDLRFWK